MESDTFINSLISTVSFWEIAGYASLFFVAVGVAGEFIHDFAPSPRRRYPWWDTWGGKVSGLILIAALAAELFTQVETNTKNAQLIAFLEKQEADLKRKAASLEQTAEQLRNDSIRMQKEFGPRMINRNLFLSALSGGPKGRFEVIYAKDDQDSWSLAIQIRELLKKAGWQYAGEMGLPTSEILKLSIVIPENVRVDVSHIDEPRETDAMLASATGRDAEPRTLFTVLSAALMRGLGRGIVGHADPAVPANQADIIIFPR